MPLGARLWHYAAEPRTLSITYLLCGLAITNTTDNQSEMWPLKFTDFSLFLYHQSYTILQGLLIPPMTFPSCHDQAQTGNPQMGEPALAETELATINFLLYVEVV